MYGHHEEHTYARALCIHRVKNASHLQITFKYTRRVLLSTIISAVSARVVDMARRIAESLSSRARIINPLKGTGDHFTEQRSSGP